MLYENFRDSYGMATETALEGLEMPLISYLISQWLYFLICKIGIKNPNLKGFF